MQLSIAQPSQDLTEIRVEQAGPSSEQQSLIGQSNSGLDMTGDVVDAGVSSEQHLEQTEQRELGYQNYVIFGQ